MNCSKNLFANEDDFFQMNNAGNYKECTENPRTRYFMLFGLNPALSSLNQTLSVCASSLCGKQAILQNFKDQYSLYGVNETSITIQDFQELNSEFRKMDSLSLLYISIISIFLFLVVLSTLVTYKRRKMALQRKISEIENSRGWLKDILDNNGCLQIEYKPQAGVLGCFDLYRNLKSLLDGGKEDALFQSFQLIRAMSAVSIVVLHSWIISSTVNERNKTSISEQKKINKSWPIFIAQTGNTGLANFFFMSGYAFIISVPKKLNKSRKSDGFSIVRSFLWMAARRYMRLMPVVLAMVMFHSKIFKFLIDGPSMPIYKRKTVCRPQDVLRLASMVFTTIIPGKQGYNCVKWMWYIQTDMRLYLLMLAAACCLPKIRHLKILCWVGFLAGFLLYSVRVVKYEIVLFSFYFYYYYTLAVTRARTYILGSLFAFYVLEGEQEEKGGEKGRGEKLLPRSGGLKEDKPISVGRKRMKKEQQKWFLNMTIFALLLVLICITRHYLIQDASFTYLPPLKLNINLVYSAIGPQISTAVLFSLVYNLFRYSPATLRYVTRSSYIQVIKNLSYSIYVSHYCVYNLLYYNSARFMGMTGLTTIGSSVFCLCWSLVFSVILHLLFEKPIWLIWNYVFERKRRDGFQRNCYVIKFLR